MIIRINIKKITKYFFYSLLLFTLIGYLGYYLYAYRNDINVYSLFSNYAWNSVGTISNIIRFAKDILICVLAIALMASIKRRSSLKLILLFVLWILMGAINAYLSGRQFSLVSGIRCYLYFFILILFTDNIEKFGISIRTTLSIIIFAQLLNFFVLIEQAYRGTNGFIWLAGQGGYRFTGLFGGNNACSSFAIACVVIFMVSDYKYKIKSLFMFLEFLISTCMAIMCGTRSALINILILLVVWLVYRIKIREKDKALLIFLALIILIPVIVSFASNIANRGSILQVQLESGRIKVLSDIISKSNPIQLLVGRGIGVGSNSDTISKGINGTSNSVVILDGTFNVVLYQYGIVGLFLLIYVFIYIWKQIKRNNSIIIISSFIGTLLLQCFTGNMLETYGFLIIIFISYWILQKPELFLNVNGSPRDISDKIV